MGLRDYRWVSEALPGRIAPMDLDCVLEKNGHILIQEFKPKGAPLPLGQRLTLKAFVRLGQLAGKVVDVWVVWEDGDMVEVGAMDRHGNVPFIETMRKNRLKRRVVEWFEEAVRDDG
jgi:hypothetical protein